MTLENQNSETPTLESKAPENVQFELPKELSPYHIQLESFEGPLDLLLHLIRQSEIDIYNIPIAFITQQYLDYIELMTDLNLEVAGEFLVMAATLAHIKSKMLIPEEPSQEDVLDEGQDPREELVRRLLEYQKYKDASTQLDARPVLGRDTFVRHFTRSKSPIPASERELAEISVFKLMEAFSGIVQTLERSQAFHAVDLEPISVLDCAESIREAIFDSKEGSIRFKRLFRNTSSRLRIVVTFLAVLDLIKRGYIRVVQASIFSEIEVIGTDTIYKEWENTGVDEYAGSRTN